MLQEINEVDKVLIDASAAGLRFRKVKDRLSIIGDWDRIDDDLRARVTRLKSEIIERIANTVQTSTSSTSDSIVKAQRGCLFPASYSQQSLWIEQKLQSDKGSLYNILYVLRISGPFDRAAASQAFNAIVQRHECLRSVFVESQNGNLLQEIKTAEVFRIRNLHANGQNDPEMLEYLNDLIDFEKRYVFDLTSEIPMRVSIVSEATDRHFLIINVHHITFDGWSMSILMHEFCELYKSFVESRNSPLSPLRIQYADYAVWQRRQMEDGAHEKKLTYWQKKLAGLAATHNLPLDRPRKFSRTFNGFIHTRTLDAALSDVFSSFCKAAHITKFIGFLAAFSTLLSRYSDESDIVIGTPSANRDKEELVPLIGFFVNNLALRVDLSNNPSYKSLVSQCKQVVLEAHANQGVPFESVINRVNPGRSASHAPLFQIMLVFHAGERSAFDIPGISIESVEIKNETALYDLTLHVFENNEQLVLNWESSTDVFESHSISRMAAHFETLLSSLVQAPDKPVFEIEMLSNEECLQQLAVWNGAESKNNFNLRVNQLFEAQVERYPSRCSLSFDGRHMSYLELNNRSNQLAHYLLDELDLQSGDVVGVFLDRSFDFVISILAILKAGGTYMPMDPLYPVVRLSHMVVDSGVKVIITNSILASRADWNDTVAIFIDSELTFNKCSEKTANNVELKNGGIARASAAYLIYTSGSTGKPKGVLISHESVVNFLSAMSEEPGISDSDAILAVTSFSFDIHVLEIFLPICVGARVVIASASDTKDALALIALLNSQSITIMQATPTTWKMLVESNWKPSGAFKLLSGGEPMGKALLKDLLTFRSTEIWNLYGPTETTVWSCVKKMDRIDDSVIIGRPILNTRVYVSSKFGSLLPVGVPGELLIGGKGVALGYLGAQSENLTKFVDRRFSGRSVGTVYRTGDVVRWTEGGELEFIGRVDSQVKIHGFRIELGEIETAISLHREVSEVLVRISKEESSAPAILAFIVVKRMFMKESAEGGFYDRLREKIIQSLKSQLPYFMVPHDLIFLTSFPLLPNGKVNYSDLAKHEVGKKSLSVNTVNEVHLTNALSELLPAVKIDLQSSIFDIGGNSLLALRLIARLQANNLKAEVNELFANRSLRDFAKTIHAAEPREELEGGRQAKHIPLMFSQYRFFSNPVLDPKPDVMIDILKLDEGVDIDRLVLSIESVCSMHHSLSSRFVQQGNYWCALLNKAETNARASIVRLSESEAENLPEVCQKLVDDEIVKFNFESGYLLKFILVDGQKEGWRLIFLCHHILVDAYSLGLIEQDIADMYTAYSQGSLFPLRNQGSSPESIAKLMNSYVFEGGAERELDFWLSKDMPEIRMVPFDYDADIDQKRLTEKSQDFVVGQDELSNLTKSLSDEGRNLFYVLVFSVLESIEAMTGEGWVQLDCSFSGRSDFKDLDCSRTVGYLAHRRLLILEVQKSGTLAEKYKNIEAQLTETPLLGVAPHVVPHLDHLVKKRSPIYNRQVSLNFQDSRGSVGRMSMAGGSNFFNRDPQIELVNKYFQSHDRYYMLEIIAHLTDDSLSVTCLYSGAQYTERTVKSFLGAINQRILSFAMGSGRKG